jgi:hypothetical protein
MQLYASDKPSSADDIGLRLNHCAERIMSWCASRQLQLNGSKSEIAWFGSHASLLRLASQDLTLSIGPDVIQPNDAVRDLGVWLDSELMAWAHRALRSATSRGRPLRERSAATSAASRYASLSVEKSNVL